MKKRVGLYFGSFNPVHIGHLVIANHIREFSPLDEVWLVVSPHNPFKLKESLASDYDRMRMTEMAVEPYHGLKACDVEFSLPKPSYTSDTLVYLCEKYPDLDFCLIIGSDNVRDFHKWKNYEFLLRNFPLYIYARPGYDDILPEAECREVNIMQDVPRMEISASLVREYIRQKKEARPLLPAGVFGYIEKNNLYL